MKGQIKPIYYIRWIVLFLLLGMLFFTVVHKCKVKMYYTSMGVVDKEGNVLTIVTMEQLQQLLKYKKVIINKKYYTYKIILIKSDFIIEGKQIYKQVLLKINLPKSLLTTDNTFSIIVPKETISVYRILESCFKEE